MFEQGDASDTRRHGGLGAGLTIARDFFRPPGFTITVESAPEQRAGVRVSLDGTDSGKPRSAAVSLASPTTQSIRMHKDSVAEARILIVDDEPANVLLLRHLLSRKGYQRLYETTDARGVLAQVDRLQPDLILLDLHMPHVGGLEILRELRAAERPGSYRPVLVLTADATPESKREALQAGANDFVTKPFDTSEVLLRVRNLIHTRLLHVQMEGRVEERTRALEEAQVEILERLAQAAEFRDDDTGQHTQRVGNDSARLARALGMPTEEVDLIRRAAPLHDVGKIAIPDSILLKPGRLTPEEWEVMRTHTTSGARILSGGRSKLVAMAEEIALYHHERWDGTGYPHGIRGEEIPLVARIVAVADFFDALSHDRPYRPAWPTERVIEEMERSAGSHFDPEIVRAFVRLPLGRSFDDPSST